ncbi:putative protein kinase RLK-Pelle-CrRLK1L-1 family [Helianthus annuus]|nr:putative protein kinase RLK-Pelle-CrRLK1L-1 family [Helianthus annuus]
MTTTIPKFAHLQIPLEDVVNATNNFADDNIIGRGGLGHVYKGQLQRSGELIKISALRLDRKHGGGVVEFWTEVSMLSDLKHPNIVSIVGFCDEQHEKIIVTTYEAKNGSLKEHLSNPNLTWTQRLKISVGVARALSYLHYDEGRGYGVIHLNINSSTILLDENWEPKLSGFKVSIKQSLNRMDQVVLSEPIGTIGYLDPEIGKTKGVTCKSDIYAFGVVLFEILCGRRAYIRNDANRLLAPLVMQHYENDTLPDIIHPDLKNQMSGYQISVRSLRTYSETAYSCLKEERSHRPHMLSIVNKLEKALEKALRFQPRPENFGNKLEHLKIELDDIKLATHNFSDTYKIGSDNFYTWYEVELGHFDKENPSSIEGISKSKLFKRHNAVVIKQFLSKVDELEEEIFFTELEVLASVKHHNIVTLIGFCVEGFERILVTEKSSNGSLGDYLGNAIKMHNLTWEKRLKICIDGAHALNYLHYEMTDKKMMIHSNITPFRFGLDENWRAKIEDFELAVFLPPNQKDETLYRRTYFESKYHVDPEYAKTGKLKRESDVYSFGVVMFEILCGRVAWDQIYLTKSKKGLVHVARQNFSNGTIEDIIDPILKEETSKQSHGPIGKANKDSLYTFLKVANQCVADSQDQRPAMKVVLNELEQALVFQVSQEQVQEPNKDQVVDELRITTFQVPEEQVQQLGKDQVDDKLEKARHEILNMASTMNQFAHLQIPLEDVAKATNNYHHDNIIEHGGVGIVYKGRLLWSGRLMEIAARRFDCKHGDGDLEFLAEISALSDLKHKNLVSIIGFCDAIDEKIIVTTYGANGSLGQYLNSLNLTWKQRLRICLGVARALSYLHYDKGRDYAILHCNINSNTILLDNNWEAKLSSFEFSIKQSLNYKDHVCPCEHAGTMGCMDPTIEKTGGVTHKSDIYSFGVVLFETLCGRKAFIQNEADRSLAQMAKYGYENGTLHDIIHPQLLNQILSPQSLLIYSKVAYSCLNEDRADRPNMHYITAKLEKALELQLHGENIENKLGQLKIHLNDIKSSTNNFSQTHKISSLDDDYTLYKAELHCLDKENRSSQKGKYEGEHLKGQSTVVLKRYPSGHDLYGEEEFFTEIEILTRVKHPNIVNLLGFCVEDSEMVLVIENISNGYLADYLGNVNHMRILTWEKRLKICIDVAHALNYLHYEMEDQKMIINRQINSYSIGLDENWGAKIVDFWFSVFLPPNQEDEALYHNSRIGRPFNSDPQYEKTGRLKRESDVYSFGVVLFEILCGRRANDPIYKENARGLGPVARQSFCMGTLEGMIDPILKDELGENNFVLCKGPNKDSLHTFMTIAYQCVAETQDQRPTMKVVVKELEKALSFQLNSEVKSDYVEEKSYASIIETQVVELSNELNNMNMTGESENFKIHNKENMLHDQTDDPAEPDCSGDMWVQESQTLRMAATPSWPNMSETNAQI